jgi:hypothetical protein
MNLVVAIWTCAMEMFERYDTVDEEDILDAMEKLEKKCSESAVRENENE